MHALLKTIYERNSFRLPVNDPHIVVLRNTNPATLLHIEDTGVNNCDTILLVDENVVRLPGRTYPHIKYQKEQMEGKSACNYIASGFYSAAWRRGWHRGFKALVQHRSFTIWRSRDLTLGNEDDYIQTDIVADNMHGYAPYSAGCVTVQGSMNPPDGAWKTAYDWIYTKNSDIPFFSVAILENSDLTAEGTCLRIGSRGSMVGEIQRSLGLKIDNDFGPMTFAAVIAYQKKEGLNPTGIVDPRTLAYLLGGSAA